MGVTNLNGNEEDTHVKQIAECALELVDAASTILIDEEDPTKGFLKIRVGFHSVRRNDMNQTLGMHAGTQPCAMRAVYFLPFFIGPSCQQCRRLVESTL